MYLCLLQFFNDVRRVEHQLSQLSHSVDSVNAEHQHVSLDVSEQLIHQLQVSDNSSNIYTLAELKTWQFWLSESLSKRLT